MNGLKRRHFQVEDLRGLRNYFFASRRPVQGQYAGRHASPQHGHSVEFSDYRPYMPGDSPADVDWKVLGRSDRLFVKLFEHQTDMTVSLLIDASASMAYAGFPAEVSKFDCAARLAALLAFLVTRQQDQVAFALARAGLQQFHPPQCSAKHLLSLLDCLENTIPAESGGLANALAEMATRVGRRGLVVLFSDLLEDFDALLKALAIFTHRGSEVVIFHILHPDELRLPEVEGGWFIDSETHQRLVVNVGQLRPSYRRTMESFLEQWRQVCRRRRMDYNLVTTVSQPRRALERYLFNRAAVQ